MGKWLSKNKATRDASVGRSNNTVIIGQLVEQNAFVFGAGGLRFKSRAGQIEHNAANGSPPLRHFFKKSCVSRKGNDTWMGIANSLDAMA